MDSFSCTWIFRGPISALVVSLVKLKPPVKNPAKPRTIKIMPVIRAAFM
jgi:hypothetical protein